MNYGEKQEWLAEHLELEGLKKLQGEWAARLAKENPEEKVHLKRYRILLEKIQSFEHHKVPNEIREAPFSSWDEKALLPKKEGKPEKERPRVLQTWKRTPWFVRTGVEGLAIALTVFLVVATVPRLKDFYQESIERRMKDYGMDQISEVLKASSETDPEELVTEAQREFVLESMPTYELPDSDASVPTGTVGGTTVAARQVVANEAEIWRFYIRTESAEEVREQIQKILRDLGLPADTQGIRGVEAPGGIQFKLLMPKETIPPLKIELENIVVAETGGSLTPESFTWFKKRSYRRLPRGYVRAVIWLYKFTNK